MEHTKSIRLAFPQDSDQNLASVNMEKCESKVEKCLESCGSTVDTGYEMKKMKLSARSGTKMSISCW